MSALIRRVLASFGILLTFGMCVWAFSPNAVQNVDPATLHPQRSIVYLAWDGSEEHAAAIQETAQYKALVESGLWDYGSKVLSEMLPAFLAQAAPHTSNEEFEQLIRAKSQLQAIAKSGFSISVTDGPDGASPRPALTMVLHDLSDAEREVLPWIQLLGMREDVQTKTVAGRNIQWAYIPDTPGIELAWYREAQHLVITVGIAASEQAVAVAEGDTPNVTSSRQWTTYHDAEVDFEIASLCWFDFGSLRNRFGEFPVPLPPSEKPVTINDFAEALGLSNLETTVGQFGYRGVASISQTFVEARGERTGLLALLDQPVFTVDDLPPMPAATTNFAGISLDLAKAWDISLAAVRKTLTLLPPQAGEEFETNLAALPNEIGLNLRDDLFAPLGNLHCIFDDPAGGPLGFGFGLAVSVRDRDRLNRTVGALLARLETELQRARLPMPIAVQRSEFSGQELITVPAGMFTPTVVISDKWLAMALYPQPVKAFLMREEGRLPQWEPTAEHKIAMAELPTEFSTISVDDPRKALQALYSFVPMLNSGLHTMAPGGAGGVKAAELPPQELVIAPLFPNVRVSVPGADGFLFTGRQSLPVMPMPSAESGIAVPVLVALLLPAVQQAREAARRTQSKNNLKQLGLAMHNYADVYQHFPAGTVQDTNLKPNERLSFFYSVLPFIEQAALYNEMFESEKSAWNSEQNLPSATVQIPTMRHPGIDNGMPHATHYVGISGVGADAAELAIDHERAGIFGYDRKTRFRDILDGTSNTIMITETTDAGIPWAAGGQTLKSLTQEPYINGPDGIGGPSPGGCNVLFADGSVRFISDFIDAETMRRLAAKADGKVVGEF